MQVLVALVCLLPSLSIWATYGQPENRIDLLGDPDRYNDKRQNYGVCCNGRRRAGGKRSFDADSRLLNLLKLALTESRPKPVEILAQRDVNLRDRHCCKTPGQRPGRQDEYESALQKEILWKALLSAESAPAQGDEILKRRPGPVGVSFGG